MTLACTYIGSGSKGGPESLLIRFVSESGGNGTFLGSRSCKFKPLLVEKGCITPCTSSARGNFSMNPLNGNGSGCYPRFQSAAWKEGLNLLELWREMKPIFPASAGVVKLIAFKRWKCYAQIGNYLQKRTQSFEPQKGWSICLGDSENSDLERTWVEWHHFSDNLGISLQYLGAQNYAVVRAKTLCSLLVTERIWE